MRGIVLLIMAVCLVLTGCSQVDTAPNANNNALPYTPVSAKPSDSKIPPPEPEPVDMPESQTIKQGIIPVRISIPAIKVDTTVEHVGLLENGQMDVPGSYETVGWFEPGIQPGNNGNAAIAGHLDHYTGPAVFFNLKELGSGDLIMISDENDKTLTFVVQSVESYKTEEAPLQRIFGDADQPHLNLITCDGYFDKATQESERRLVVYTDLLKE
jgi:LPXTG-site transpeptidase (sortase) family protein